MIKLALVIIIQIVNDFVNIHLVNAINNDSLNANEEWISKVKSIVNNFESNAGLISKIVLRSGKEVNSLGRYDDWK